MILTLGNIVQPGELRALQGQVQSLAYQDGRSTAGSHAGEVKANTQAIATPDSRAIIETITDRLRQNPVFQSAARPRHFASTLISRYEPGQSYGPHTDNAIMAGHRADLSYTFFLSPTEDYEGGELVIEDGLESRAIRLQAGQVILYPSSSLHHVSPVTAGVRYAVVGWITSWVRSAEQREILFDLDQAIARLSEARIDRADLDRLTKTRSNLIRMWAGG